MQISDRTPEDIIAELLKEIASLKQKVDILSTGQCMDLKGPISVRDLAARIGVKPNYVLRLLVARKMFCSINSEIDEKIAADVVRELKDTTFGLLNTVEDLQRRVHILEGRPERKAMLPSPCKADRNERFVRHEA